MTESTWLELSPSLTISGIIAGVDEVGRGALFGPVVSAAVILPQEALPQLVAFQINDSKKLSAARRKKLAQEIVNLAVDWQIGYASVAEIDRLNILQATLLAMKRAVVKLPLQPDICWIDGNQRIPDLSVPQETLVKGDSRSLTIASASIIAKVWRDDLLVRLDTKYPMYDLKRNKGYGSQKHLQALLQHGPSRLHRQSFRPCQIQGMSNG
ncbi:MAG: ribonuclease HII [Nostocaceae cyanobacterium]|nr:ribonuclease HII [Nostocaceae cyanobacterium]